MKVQGDSPLNYHWNTIKTRFLWSIKVLYDFLTSLGVAEILCNFRLVLERKTGKEILESSRLDFLEKFLANNFALSDAEDNISGPLNKGSNGRFTFF